MAGTPQDWVEPRGSSLERESGMAMMGSPPIGAGALPDQAAAQQVAPADAQQHKVAGDDLQRVALWKESCYGPKQTHSMYRASHQCI